MNTNELRDYNDRGNNASTKCLILADFAATLSPDIRLSDNSSIAGLAGVMGADRSAALMMYEMWQSLDLPRALTLFEEIQKELRHVIMGFFYLLADELSTGQLEVRAALAIAIACMMVDRDDHTILGKLAKDTLSKIMDISDCHTSKGLLAEKNLSASDRSFLREVRRFIIISGWLPT